MGASLLFDLAGRGSVVLAGKDRATFLHGLVTNDVRKLRAGEGCAAAFLTAKGKMLAECVVLAEADRLVLDTPPELAGTVEQLLRKYLVFNDVTIGNETGETHVFHLAGAAAGDGRETEDLLRRVIEPGAGATLPQSPHANAASVFTFSEDLPAPPQAAQSPGGAEGAGSPRAAAGGAVPILIVRENRTGLPGYDLRIPSSVSEEIRNALSQAGARQATDEELESGRIRAGLPRWGAELTEAVLPDEAGLRERGFISETKGCYVGQEIVARIKTYGHVNRLLVRLDVLGGVPKTGDKISFEGEEIGVVTSATAGGATGEAAALAYVKRTHANPGARFLIRTLEGDLPAVFSPVPLG